MSTPGASSADRAEQNTPVVPEPAEAVDVPLEAPDADVVEQAAAVPFDEDEHRGA